MSATVAKASIAVISRTELLELRDAEAEYAAASKAFTVAENKVKPLRLALAAKALGISTAEEFKALDPEAITKRFEERLAKGRIEIVRGAPQFSFEKTSDGRYPAWKKEFIAVAGEVAAENITAATEKIYSYRVVVKLAS